MDDETYTRSVATANLVLVHQLLLVLVAKGGLSAEEGTLVVSRSVQEMEKSGRPDVAGIITKYFAPELNGSWVQRAKLLDGPIEGTA